MTDLEKFALKGETFKPLVAPFEKYLVSDYGRVWNSKTKKPVALSKCHFSNHKSRGYLACNLASNLRWVTPRVNTTDALNNELQKYTRWLIQKTQEGTIDKEK